MASNTTPTQNSPLQAIQKAVTYYLIDRIPRLCRTPADTTFIIDVAHPTEPGGNSLEHLHHIVQNIYTFIQSEDEFNPLPRIFILAFVCKRGTETPATLEYAGHNILGGMPQDVLERIGYLRLCTDVLDSPLVFDLLKGCFSYFIKCQLDFDAFFYEDSDEPLALGVASKILDLVIRLRNANILIGMIDLWFPLKVHLTLGALQSELRGMQESGGVFENPAREFAFGDMRLDLDGRWYFRIDSVSGDYYATEIFWTHAGTQMAWNQVA